MHPSTLNAEDQLSFKWLQFQQIGVLFLEKSPTKSLIFFLEYINPSGKL